MWRLLIWLLQNFLQYKDQNPSRIHNLPELCRLCIELDPTFETILKDAADLNPYGNAARYPVESLIDEGMTQIAIAQAQSVYDFALAKIPYR